MTDQFKPGDVVRNKHTGELMIVECVSDYTEEVLCSGIAERRSNLEPTGATFDLQEALEKAVAKVMP